MLPSKYSRKPKNNDFTKLLQFGLVWNLGPGLEKTKIPRGFIKRDKY